MIDQISQIKAPTLTIQLFCLDEFVQKYDIETVLTRMLLKSMIEYLSQSSNLSIEGLLSTMGGFSHEQV